MLEQLRIYEGVLRNDNQCRDSTIDRTIYYIKPFITFIQNHVYLFNTKSLNQYLATIDNHEQRNKAGSAILKFGRDMLDHNRD